MRRRWGRCSLQCLQWLYSSMGGPSFHSVVDTQYSSKAHCGPMQVADFCEWQPGASGLPLCGTWSRPCIRRSSCDQTNDPESCRDGKATSRWKPRKATGKASTSGSRPRHRPRQAVACHQHWLLSRRIAVDNNLQELLSRRYVFTIRVQSVFTYFNFC